MARRVETRTRVLVITAALVSGLMLGVLVIGLAGGGRQPAVYQPFSAGTQERITGLIEQDGPVFYPDPRNGIRAFYLDLEGGKVVALHVVPPGGTARCPVQWDRAARRYTDCRGTPVDQATLRRFPVLTRPQGNQTAVFVDLRTIEPPPAPASNPGVMPRSASSPRLTP
jgi:hypothetical protein